MSIITDKSPNSGCFLLSLFLDTESCSSSPCLHNGTCINELGYYNCVCEQGWEEKNCDIGKYYSPTLHAYLLKDDKFEIRHIFCFLSVKTVLLLLCYLW